MRRLPALLLLLLATGCGQEVAEVPAGTTGHGWSRLADSPLSPRQGSVTAYVDGEVVVVGGYTGRPCPPNADCAFPRNAYARDGAAYDVEAGTWRRIAEAPRPVPEHSAKAVVGERLFVLVDEALLVWDGAGDTWSEVAAPAPLRWGSLVADGTRLVVVSGSDERGVTPDRVLDTRTGEWSTLPEDPFKPAFDRVLTPTPEGLLLTAKPIEPDGDPADPALVHAAVLPRDGDPWRTLPVAPQLGGWRWSWTGQRLVDPSLGGADGGEVNNYGRVIPYGGRLDPVAGTWAPLPDAPEEHTGGWSVEAPGGAVMAAEGWVYDDRDGSWTRLPRPDGAPEEPGSALWAGETLLVVGGADWTGGLAATSPEDVWSTGVWAYRPD